MSPADAVDAAARLAALLDKAGRQDLAAIYYRQLADRLGDVAGPGGKTGKQLVEDLPADQPRRQLAGPDNGPGRPAKSRLARPGRGAERRQRGPRSVDLEVVGPRGPFFEDMTVSLDLQTQMLVGKDGFGENTSGFRFTNIAAVPWR